MNKIFSFEQAIDMTHAFHEENKSIILVGGCFDILHLGHIEFLKRAKEKGDVLIVMLESDASVKKRKGEHKPVNSQDVRAKILAAIASVDAILLLPELTTDAQYDQVVLLVKPAIIATTKGDPGKVHKERQAKTNNATLIEVIDRLADHASSLLAEKII